MKTILSYIALSVVWSFSMYWAKGHDISVFNHLVIFVCGVVFGRLFDLVFW